MFPNLGKGYQGILLQLSTTHKEHLLRGRLGTSLRPQDFRTGCGGHLEAKISSLVPPVPRNSPAHGLVLSWGQVGNI